MTFFVWLEASGLGEWVRTSSIGYPMMIASHAIGMAVMVGLAVLLDMRLLGWFTRIPYKEFDRFLTIAWAGFTINLLSGTALFTTQAATYVTDITFLLKMAFVVAGVVMAVFLGGAINRAASWPTTAAPGGIRLVAAASIACWVGATVTGRLIAYL